MQLLRFKEAAAKAAVSKTTIKSMVAAGTFPPPIRLGKRVYFLREEIDVWMHKLMKKRG